MSTLLHCHTINSLSCWTVATMLTHLPSRVFLKKVTAGLEEKNMRPHAKVSVSQGKFSKVDRCKMAKTSKKKLTFYEEDQGIMLRNSSQDQGHKINL